MQFLGVGFTVLVLAFSSSLSKAADPCYENSGYVVINVPWDDPIGGLAMRESPSKKSRRIGVIPSNGHGIGITQCTSKGWCYVSYNCQEGWAYAAKYLSPKINRLNAVVGVSPSDPEGLNVRTGPRDTYSRIGSIPYDGRGIIKHICQDSPKGGNPWCLVTYLGSPQAYSGWVASRFLQSMDSSEPTIPPPPIDTASPPEPQPSGGSTTTSRACQLYPNLC